MKIKMIPGEYFLSEKAIIANGQKENPISSAIAHDNCTVIEHE